MEEKVSSWREQEMQRPKGGREVAVFKEETIIRWFKGVEWQRAKIQVGKSGRAWKRPPSLDFARITVVIYVSITIYVLVHWRNLERTTCSINNYFYI